MPTPEQNAKLERLKERLAAWDGCVVAFSGGVDSTFLMAVAHEVLGLKCLAVLADSSTYPRREHDAAIAWLTEQGIPYETILSEELDIQGFSDNPPDRCYYCKRELYTKVAQVAQRHGLGVIADGANHDDSSDFRPGERAARELGAISPLKELGFTKDDIRTLSRAVYGLPTADKQSMACMASRIPYHSPITTLKLKQVETIEDFIAGHGLHSFRARHHGDILRLELSPPDRRRLQEDGLEAELITLAKQTGFTYITLDLEGFRSGSMNAVLKGT